MYLLKTSICYNVGKCTVFLISAYTLSAVQWGHHLRLHQQYGPLTHIRSPHSFYIFIYIHIQ